MLMAKKKIEIGVKNKFYYIITSFKIDMKSENNIFTNDKCSIKPFTNINHYYSDKLLVIIEFI